MDIKQRILDVFDDVSTFRTSEISDYIFERGVAKCRSDSIMLYKDIGQNMFGYYACLVRRGNSFSLAHEYVRYYMFNNKLVICIDGEQISITDKDIHFNTSLTHSILPLEDIHEIEYKAIKMNGSLSIYVDSM